MNVQTNTLIFTDLDGTLLDHDSYSWEAAKPALQLAEDQCVPVIPCTSKTFEECQFTQQQINLRGPFIFENGAGIALPKSLFAKPLQQGGEVEDFWLCGLGVSYEKIRFQLLDLRRRKRYQFRGFGDMSVNQVCEATGLSNESASLAMKRRYSEPMVWLDDAKSFDFFAQDISRMGLTMTRGGRFIHIAGPTDKGQAMLWLAKRYEKKLDGKVRLIALGDSMNDIPMLQAADVAVIIRPRHSNPVTLPDKKEAQQIITTDAVGPEGWNSAILSLLKDTETIHG